MDRPVDIVLASHRRHKPIQRAHMSCRRGPKAGIHPAVAGEADDTATGRNLATRRQVGQYEKAILPSPIHSQRRARSANGGEETSEVLPMLNLRKLAVIAVQATVGVALGASWGLTALAEIAPANPVTQSQTTPVLRAGDLVRLRSGGPALTVKSVHGNWVICTWWHERFGMFRTVGFPVAMIDGPITLLAAAASPQTDAGPQTNDQSSPAKRSDNPPGNLIDAGPTNQNPTAQGANQAVGVGQMGAASTLTSMSPPTTPAQALALLQGIVQTHQNPPAQGTSPVETVSPLQQGTDQTISVSRVRPALILPQSTTQTVPQGTVQTALPFQQGAATNQTVGVGQMGPAGALTSMSPQGMIGRRF
jgi:uncharacterized protein YodC (DUF2158 family)